MVSFSSFVFLVLAYATCLINAAPLDVAAPPITYPTQGVVWTPGQTQTVTWDTSNLPSQITNPVAKIVLGWTGSSGGDNLQLNTPLASGFQITDGKVDIVVPSGYPAGNSYIVVLIGDSNDISPTFTITDGGSPSSNTPSTPATTTTTPVADSNAVPGGQSSPSTTTTTTTPINNDVATSNPSPTTTTTPSHSSSPSSSPSPSPSSNGSSQNSNSSSDTSSNGAGVSKPVGSVFVALLAGSLVTLFL